MYLREWPIPGGLLLVTLEDQVHVGLLLFAANQKKLVMCAPKSTAQRMT